MYSTVSCCRTIIGQGFYHRSSGAQNNSNNNDGPNNKNKSNNKSASMLNHFWSIRTDRINCIISSRAWIKLLDSLLFKSQLLISPSGIGLHVVFLCVSDHPLTMDLQSVWSITKNRSLRGHHGRNMPKSQCWREMCTEKKHNLPSIQGWYC